MSALNFFCSKICGFSGSLVFVPLKNSALVEKFEKLL